MPETDDKNVQSDAVSTETESKEGEKVKTPTGEQAPPTTPLTPDQQSEIQKLVDKALDGAKREIQSVKDRARAEVEEAQRRARLAEATAAGYNQGLEGEDKDKAESLRNAAQLRAFQQRDAEEAQLKVVKQFSDTFHGNMQQFITSLGIDPSDKRIDWAEDVEGDYLAKQQRILTSVAAVQKELATEAEKKQSQALKDFELKLKKDLGIDSADTSASPGAGGSDAEFLEKFGAGDLPMTKENIARAEKLTQTK